MSCVMRSCILSSSATLSSSSIIFSSSRVSFSSSKASILSQVHTQPRYTVTTHTVCTLADLSVRWCWFDYTVPQKAHYSDQREWNLQPTDSVSVNMNTHPHTFSSAACSSLSLFSSSSCVSSSSCWTREDSLTLACCSDWWLQEDQPSCLLNTPSVLT